MILHLVALLVLGLMCGSELNVPLFSHPVLERQPLETRVLVRSSLAALFGRVMPFWMAGSTLLNPLLLLPFQHLNESAWRFATIAFAMQVLAVLFSLVAPVPIIDSMVRELIVGRTDLVFELVAQDHSADINAMKFLLAKGASLQSLGDNFDLNGASFHGHWRV